MASKKHYWCWSLRACKNTDGCIWRMNYVVIFLPQYYLPLSLLSDKLCIFSFYAELNKSFLAISHTKSYRNCDIQMPLCSGSPLDFAWTYLKGVLVLFLSGHLCLQAFHTSTQKGNEDQHFICWWCMKLLIKCKSSKIVKKSALQYRCKTLPEWRSMLAFREKQNNFDHHIKYSRRK